MKKTDLFSKYKYYHECKNSNIPVGVIATVNVLNTAEGVTVEMGEA